MSRLIDADALIEAMDKRYNEKKDIVPNNLAEGFMQMEKLIKEQPTAYDVEKVVEELEEERKFYRKKKIENERKGWEKSSEHNLFKELCYENAIDIVQKGGVENE